MKRRGPLLSALVGAIWLGACISSGAEPADGGLSPDGDQRPAGLFGQEPTQKLSAPDFSVQNRDSTVRTRADLIGHPTVLWFYPKSATSG